MQVQVTVPTSTQADQLVSLLLDRRLVACGQRLGPIVSRFDWDGERCEREEWLVLLKTTQTAVPPVIAALDELHPDEVPEVLVVAVSGAPAYLSWVETTVVA